MARSRTLPLSDDGHISNDITCSRCRHNLRGLHHSSNCPECGADVGGQLVAVLRASVWARFRWLTLALTVSIPVLVLLANVVLLMTSYGSGFMSYSFTVVDACELFVVLWMGAGIILGLVSVGLAFTTEPLKVLRLALAVGLLCSFAGSAFNIWAWFAILASV